MPPADCGRSTSICRWICSPHSSGIFTVMATNKKTHKSVLKWQKKQSAKSCILHLYVNLRTTCASGLRCPTSRRVYCEYCTKTVRQPILGGCCLYSFTNSSASFSSCMYRNACNSQQQTSATIKQQHRKCLRIYFHNYTYRVTLSTTAQQNTLTVISGP